MCSACQLSCHYWYSFECFKTFWFLLCALCLHACCFSSCLFSFLRISNLVPYCLDDLLSTAIIFFGARMFPSHPLAQFCKFTVAKLFSFVSSFLRFLYHLFLIQFCAPLLHCLVIYASCQRLCLLFRKVPAFGLPSRRISIGFSKLA